MLQSTTGSRYSEFKKLQNRCKDFQQKQLKYFYVLVDYYGCHRLVGTTGGPYLDKLGGAADWI